MQAMQTNIVYCADNLQVMKQLPPESIDLIYIDPPFNTGEQKKSKEACFEDDYGGIKGYLGFMEERLRQMHRLLKPTGSIYVHLDWRAVHYIKCKMDEIFGAKNFLNEIIWAYHGNASVPKKNFNKRYENILFYSKDNRKYKFNKQYLPYREDQIKRYKLKDKNGKRYYINRNKTNPKGYRIYMREGLALSNNWTDIQNLTGQKEKIGYPTQKPLALLERVIKASSNEGDIVADFFCGSGTAIVSAQNLGRKYVGCDISPKAVEITKKRLAIKNQPF